MNELNNAQSIIENELKDYEKMKAIKGTTTLDSALEQTLINSCPNVAKKLKAFEIIKIKNISMECLKRAIKREGLEWYNSLCLYPLERLNQEEYDLLKEVLL